MSLFDELKRRNVFRVGIAYVVGAWLLLQLTEVLSELLNLPEEVGPVVVAIVVIGFPIVLFAAWAYELTPQGIKRESEVQAEDSITRSTGKKLNTVILILMAVAIGYLLYDKFMVRTTGEGEAVTAAQSEPEAPIETVPEEQEAPAEPPVSPQSIAVLPFTNRSPVAEDEFFIDGIHDDLLTNLARVSGLKVISRTSVARFRETEIPIPDIARQLGVATVMEGAVQRAGKNVRINVQLIDAATDEHLWAQIYDRELTTENLFAIQTEISEAIAEALETELSADEERRLRDRPTDNLEAYSAYLRGMRAFETREVAAMQEALADFQRAVELDPDFALGWAGIAQLAEVLPSWSGMTREESQALSIPAAEKAMELAPDSGEANLALAMTLEGDEAIAQYERTIDLLPNHAMALQWYANQLQGPPGPNWAQALALLRQAVELDPMSPNHRSQLARQLLFMNRWEEAAGELQVVLDSNPDYAPAKGFMAWQSGERGNLDESYGWSRAYLRDDPDSDFPRFDLLMSLVHLQDRERLETTRNEWMDEGGQEQAVFFADFLIATLEGRFDAALENSADVRRNPGFQPDVERAWLHTFRRDYSSALAAWQEVVPEFFDEEQRSEAVRVLTDLACVVADVLRRQDQQVMADALVEDVIGYTTDILPRYQEHAAYDSNLAYCLAYQGDFEAALDQLETNYRHRHFGFWWEPRLLELFDPLRGNPRFENLMQAFEDEMARQRANLDRLEAQEAAGP